MLIKTELNNNLDHAVAVTCNSSGYDNENRTSEVQPVPSADFHEEVSEKRKEDKTVSESTQNSGVLRNKSYYRLAYGLSSLLSLFLFARPS